MAVLRRPAAARSCSTRSSWACRVDLALDRLEADEPVELGEQLLQALRGRLLLRGCGLRLRARRGRGAALRLTGPVLRSPGADGDHEGPAPAP